MTTKIRMRKNSPESLRTLFLIHKSIIRDFKYYKIIILVIIIISLLITLIINYKSDNIYLTVSEFNRLILPYFSISIGFTITSATFLINSIGKDNNLKVNIKESQKVKRVNIDKEIRKLKKIQSTYIRAVSMIIFYVIYALILLVTLFLQILLGEYNFIYGVYLVIFNYVIIFLHFSLVFYSFLLFFLIIKTVYLYCITYISHTFNDAINNIKDKNKQD